MYKGVFYEGQKNFSFNCKNRYISLNIESDITVEKTSSKIFANLYLPKNNDINKTLFNIEVSGLNIEPVGKFFKNFFIYQKAKKTPAFYSECLLIKSI